MTRKRSKPKQKKQPVLPSDVPIARKTSSALTRIYASLSAKYAPNGPEPDEARFLKWSTRALDAARFLLPVEEARLHSTVMPRPRDEGGVTSFTLRIFDHSRRLVSETRDGVKVFEAERAKPVEPDVPPVIEAEAVEIVSPAASSAPPANVAVIRPSVDWSKAARIAARRTWGR